eukprot:536063_1
MFSENNEPNDREEKKQRKERIIKNGIIDIDDVFIGPGIEYCNWTKIARIKLRQRELILLQKRQESCNQVINSAIQQFTTQCIQRFISHQTRNLHIPVYKMERDNLTIYLQNVQRKVTALNSDIMCRCRRSITNLLTEWEGSKPRKEPRSFRKYFQCCRRWFDQKKVHMLAAHFCIPIMDIVQEYTETVAAQFCEYQNNRLQHVYSTYMNILIVKCLLEAEIDPSNTRAMWLIPASVYPELVVRDSDCGKVCTNSTIDLRGEYVQLVRFKSQTARKLFEDELTRFYTYSYYTVSPNYNQMMDHGAYHNYNVYNHQSTTNPSIHCNPYHRNYNDQNVNRPVVPFVNVTRSCETNKFYEPTPLRNTNYGQSVQDEVTVPQCGHCKHVVGRAPTSFDDVYPPFQNSGPRLNANVYDTCAVYPPFQN